MAYTTSSSQVSYSQYVPLLMFTGQTLSLGRILVYYVIMESSFPFSTSSSKLDLTNHITADNLFLSLDSHVSKKL